MLFPVLLALVQSSVVLDGAIRPGEWDRAARFTGTNGLEVYALATAGELYLAVRGKGDGFPHLALVEGDTVFLLHASAALGTARFVGPGNPKPMVQPFTFRVRGTGLEGTAQAERNTFYQEEGWVATTARMGRRGETEFKISRTRFGLNRLAVAFWSESGGMQRWPAELEDGVTMERMVQGFLPEEATFRTPEWGIPE